MTQGRDVRGLLSDKDHRYVRDFTNLSYAGFANLHTLTLDVGQWSPERPLRLLLDGYIEYFSASSMYAAWQAGMQPIPPRVDVQMSDGTWKRVIRDMGFPAGLPRTIVVDLTGKLPAGARKIRDLDEPADLLGPDPGGQRAGCCVGRASDKCAAGDGASGVPRVSETD